MSETLTAQELIQICQLEQCAYARNQAENLLVERMTSPDLDMQTPPDVEHDADKEWDIRLFAGAMRKACFYLEKTRELETQIAQQGDKPIYTSQMNPRQENAWIAVNDLCRELGMPKDTRESGLELVLRFIRELYDHDQTTRDHVREKQAQIEALQQAVRAAEADTARLDWLQSKTPKSNYWQLENKPTFELLILRLTGCKAGGEAWQGNYATPREAIDAAMQAEQQAEVEPTGNAQ